VTAALAPRLGLPGTRTETSYLPPADLTFDEWCSAVGTLQAMERSVKWWLGDLLLFGEAAFPEQAVQTFPDAYSGSAYAESTMRAAMWVSDRFPRGTRVEGATWTHHRVVADLPRAEAVALLTEAARVNSDPEGGEYISSRDLLEKVKARKEKLRGLAVTVDGEAIDAAELPWTPGKSDLTDEARAALNARLAAMGRRHGVGFEAGFIACLVWLEQRDCFCEWRL
jgi:hypothetical protein